MPGKTSKNSTKVARQAVGKQAVAKTSKRPSRVKKKTAATHSEATSASKRIDKRIKELGDWRGTTLQRVREVITKADSRIVEEWKWKTPVWSCNGIICTGESYKKVVKMTFAKGASLQDPARLFNSSLEGKVRRAIDIREGEKVNAGALKTLIRAAVALNLQGKSSKAAAQPKLLAGGNPQIAKADGEAPVRAYIAAVPGWKQVIARRLDALIVRNVPNVHKAVKWNSPFYGIEGQGWFVSFHVFNRYVKVTFFRGTSLKPSPPGGTGEDARWIDVHEHGLDETQLAKWIKQAAKLPGWGKS